MTKKKVTPKQKRFVEEFLVDKNATAAAKRAGYSKKTAHSIGSENLIKPEVKKEISAALKEQSERTLITADRVLEEIYNLAMCDIGEAYNEDGSLKPIKEIPEAIRRAISSVETEEIKGPDGSCFGQTKKIKFWEKSKNLEMLAKHFKLLTEKFEVQFDESLAIRMKEARERAKNDK